MSNLMFNEGTLRDSDQEQRFWDARASLFIHAHAISFSGYYLPQATQGGIILQRNK
jgi:hypothetical protein